MDVSGQPVPGDQQLAPRADHAGDAGGQVEQEGAELFDDLKAEPRGLGGQVAQFGQTIFPFHDRTDSFACTAAAISRRRPNDGSVSIEFPTTTIAAPASIRAAQSSGRHSPPPAITGIST